MANWCYNIVIFEGENSNSALQEFRILEEEQKTNDIGLVPAWFQEENKIIDFDKHLFNVNVDEIEQVRFETKWAPDPNVILAIAVKHNVSFTYSFDENSNGVFGKYTYDSETQSLKEYSLNLEDFMKYNETDEGDYIYKNEKYESEYDILEQIFKEKFGIDF